MKKILILMMAVFSFMTVNAQNDIKVTVHEVVEAGEQFNVTFAIEGNVDSKHFSWTPGNGLELLWGPQYGHSSSTSFINGKKTSSSQSTFTYIMRCNTPGKYILSPATAEVKGKTLTSKPVEIEVVKGRAQSQSSSEEENNGRQSGDISSDEVFMRFALDKSHVVVGEPIHATLKLYLRADIAGLEGFTPPKFNGFWTKETKSPQTLEFGREKYKDQIWSVSTIREYVLIPQQVGNLKISPAELVCLVNVRDNSYGNSQLDFFFNGGYKTVNKKLMTDPVTVHVSPLPQPAPVSSGGAVGNFTISASLQTDSLDVNTASSLIVKIKGSGNISLIGQPLVSFPPDFESYDVKISEKLDASGLRGEKTYEYPFIARSAGDFEIPAISFSYYDLKKKSYVTTSAGPLPVHVVRKPGQEPETLSSGPDVVKAFDQQEVGTLNKDIRYISREHGKFVPKGTFFLGTPAFWLIFFLMLVVSFLFWSVSVRLAARKADVVMTRTRKATKMAMRRLKDADKFRKQNIHGSFYEELHKALLGFAADKLNMPYGELSRERIGTLLEEHGACKEHVEAFLILLDACEFARYAPSTATGDMSSHYEAALDLISNLDAEIRTIKNTSMKVTSILILLLLIPSFAGAMDKAESDSLWNAANAAYNEGEWASAVGNYTAIEDAGLESPELYFNIANAYYKDGDIPSAILYYNKTLRLDPSNEDAVYNLDLANRRIKDKIDPVPEFILKTWMRDFCYSISSDSWTIIFLVFMAVTLVMLLLFLLASSVAAKRTGFFVGLVTLLFSVLTVSMAIWQKNSYDNDKEAVVMTPVISVKSSPSEDASTELFLLHEGTKVDVLQTEDDWLEIRLVDGRRGWLLSRNVARID